MYSTSVFRTLQFCVVWLAQMNSRLMILRSFFLRLCRLSLRTPDEDWNCCRPLKASSFGISSCASPCCYQRCSDASPKVGRLHVLVYFVYWFFRCHPELVVPLADDGPEVRELSAKLSELPRRLLILTLRWRFVLTLICRQFTLSLFFSFRIILLVMVLLLLHKWFWFLFYYLFILYFLLCRLFQSSCCRLYPTLLSFMTVSPIHICDNAINIIRKLGLLYDFRNCGIWK